MLAVLSGRTEAAQLMIKAGADVNIVNGEGYAALFLATQYGLVSVVQLLLAAGADPKRVTGVK